MFAVTGGMNYCTQKKVPAEIGLGSGDLSKPYGKKTAANGTTVLMKKTQECAKSCGENFISKEGLQILNWKEEAEGPGKAPGLDPMISITDMEAQNESRRHSPLSASAQSVTPDMRTSPRSTQSKSTRTSDPAGMPLLLSGTSTTPSERTSVKIRFALAERPARPTPRRPAPPAVLGHSRRGRWPPGRCAPAGPSPCARAATRRPAAGGSSA